MRSLSVTEYSGGVLTGMNSDAYDDYRTLSLPFRKRMMHLCTNDTSVLGGNMNLLVGRKLNMVERCVLVMSSHMGWAVLVIY